MASVDNSAWDASKAWKAGASSDNPTAFYNGICAGKKAGDPSTQEAHALPHHYKPGDPPNANGVRNSLSRIGQTQGLTNKAAAQAHLDGHMTAIKAAKESGRPVDMRAMRALHADSLPGGAGRSSSFPAKFRGQQVKLGNKLFYEVEGYATVFDRGYQMWDEFGPFTEIADQHMLDRSMAMRPDVAFLLNHKGLTMARTTSANPTLTLAKDTTGLKVNALLNLDRSDVRDLASAIDDGLIDEMSFAFLLEEGEWNDDFDEFRITQANIDRGDVSAVNYGANPYTSIGARAQEFMRTLDEMPDALRAEVVAKVARSEGGAVIMRAAKTLATASTERYERAARDMAEREDASPFSDWDIEDLTEEGEDASTGEFAAKSARAGYMPADPTTDPIESVEAASVPDNISVPDVDNDEDESELNGTSVDVSRGKSVAEQSVHLMESDEISADAIADQMRSAEKANTETGVSLDLLMKRYKSTDFTV